jgi:hypothetical protein
MLSGWCPSPDRRQDLSDPGGRSVLDRGFQGRAELATIGACHFITSSVARTARCTPSMRETRVCATGAQQRPSREVHRGPASGAAGVSGSVTVCGEGAGTRGRGEATYSRSEGGWSSARDDATTNRHFQKQTVTQLLRWRWCSSVRLSPQLATAPLLASDRSGLRTARRNARPASTAGLALCVLHRPPEAACRVTGNVTEGRIKIVSHRGVEL